MQILSILTILYIFSSCQGQVKMNLPHADPYTFPILVRTQGTNQYQNIMCGIEDKQGHLWFGTSGEGVYKYDGENFTQYTLKDGLLCNAVFSILIDKTGMIWLGTRDGICQYDGKKFTEIIIPKEIRTKNINKGYYTTWSTENTVWSMLQDKSGTIWIGTGDGVYTYKNQMFTHFLADDKIINKDSLHLKLISDIQEDNNGIIWFASGMPPGFEGLCRFDGKEIVRFKPKKEGWFRNIVKSKNGNLLLATRRFGVWSYEGKTFSDYDQPKELYKESINRIMEDRVGRLWIASDYGKVMGDTLGGLWYSSIPSDMTSQKSYTKIINKDVYFMLEDRHSNIWFGTRGMGLYRYDGKKLINYSE